jgi:hypothetical protein
MQKLGLGLSLPNMGKNPWEPMEESSLLAWYKFNDGIVLNGTDVRDWADSSGNGHLMKQLTASEQPAYTDGYLTFDSADTQNLQTSPGMELSGAFTVGIRFYADAFNNVLIGDNTTANEFFKLTSSSRIAVKIDGTTRNMDLDSGTFGNGYIVLTRDSSNVLTLWHNGVEQSGSGALAGTSDIDAIGVRKTDVNAYDGRLWEIQIYTDTSASLTTLVNNYLATIKTPI